MKFLIDESVDFSVTTFLRELNFDVKTIVETEPSSEDKDVLALANREDRVLITNDKGFGDFIFKDKLPHKGVVLLRLEDESPQAKIEKIRDLLDEYKDSLSNNFIVVTENKVRVNKT